MENNETNNSVAAPQHMIECENLVKIYKTKDIEVMALQGLDLTIDKGEFVAIIGNSGSGKSTFLNMIGGLDRPSAGKLTVAGKNLFKLNEKELVSYKQSTVGFVWQNNARNLFPYLTALQNVMLPMLFISGKQRKARALKLLELVGMSHKKDRRLFQLSGGEQQRIAIAIALSNNPEILLADEPTGSVDAKTSDSLLAVFKRLNTELGLTIVIVTHDNGLANKVDRVVLIRDGKNSSERIMKQSYKESLSGVTGFENTAESHDEYAMLDRAGRVQLPKEILEQIGVKGNKVKMELSDGHIVISNPDSTKN